VLGPGSSCQRFLDNIVRFVCQSELCFNSHGLQVKKNANGEDKRKRMLSVYANAVKASFAGSLHEMKRAVAVPNYGCEEEACSWQRTLPLKNLKRNRLGLHAPITAPFTLSVLDESLCAERLESTKATYTAAHHECGKEAAERRESARKAAAVLPGLHWSSSHERVGRSR
jgi:hypothetical protein